MLSNNHLFVSGEKYDSLMNKLEIEWDNFIRNSNHPSEFVRDSIFESWKRARKSGVKSNLQVAPMRLDDIQLEEERQKRRLLLDLVIPRLEAIARAFPADIPMAVIFSDETGVILEGRYVKYAASEKTNYIPGGDWNENAVGTTGPGIALVTGQPNKVFAYEHYSSAFHMSVCSSAPICDTITGTPLGVLTVTADRNRVEAHCLNWIIAEARGIEKDLERRLQRESSSAYDLLFHKIDQPVIVFDHSGKITKLNTSAQDIFRAKVGNNLETIFRFDNGQPFLFNQSFDTVCRMTEKRFVITTVLRTIGHYTVGGIALFQSDQSNHKSIARRPMSFTTQYDFSSLVGRSQALQKSIELAKKASQFDSPILITGETGTGKEVLAQAIHNNSPRKHYPLVSINCGAIPKELIASELFGYEEGAFTGAQRGGKKGKLEAADGGTLFLDEVGDMSFDLQVYLLRVLEDSAITRIGSFNTVPVNVRVICATNKDLRLEMEEGRFRRDLFYRINSFEISLPPLRERKEDIHQLSRHFLGLKSKGLEFTPEGLAKLSNYSWPGNIRELRSIIERAFIVCDKVSVKPNDIQLPEPTLRCERSNTQGKKLEQIFTRDILFEMLNECSGNITLAAKRLQVSRMTLYRKMRKFNIATCFRSTSK